MKPFSCRVSLRAVWLSTSLAWGTACINTDTSPSVEAPDGAEADDVEGGTAGTSGAPGEAAGAMDVSGAAASAGAAPGGSESTPMGAPLEGTSGVPVPASDNVPRPSGTGANLRVLPWAGFSAAVSYSFDDSQPSQVAHWPVLSEQGVRMTFYINSSANWISGYDAVWQDAIARGHEIANHTVHHCHPEQLGGADLANCPNGLMSQDEEIEQCSAYIETNLGQSGVWTFAYPFGDLGYRAAAESRFLLARGVSGGMIAPNDATDPFNLPTIAHAGDPTVPGGDPVATFNADIDAAVGQGRWIIFLLHSILPTPDNWYAGEDIASITGSIEHAKELGNVWIDSVVNIGAYWLGQRIVQAVTPSSEGGATTWTWSLPEHFPPGRMLRVSVDGGVLSQSGNELVWDAHGYYEVALDAGSLTWTP